MKFLHKALMGGKSDAFWVMVNLSGPRYWKISKDGDIRQTEEPAPDEGPVISFDEYDYRGVFDKHATRRGAKKHFLREYSEKCRLLYLGGRRPIYATPINRLAQFDHKIYPGAWYLDELLSRDKITPDGDRIIGFSFERQDENDPFRIIILYAWHADGSFSAPEVSLNPPDMELVVSEFAKAKGVESEEIFLYPSEDIFEIGHGFSYPTEEDVLGVPMSIVYNMAAMGIFTGFMVMSGVGAWNITHRELVKKEVKHYKAEISKLKNEQSQYVYDHAWQYAKVLSIHPKKLIGAAENLVEPNIRILEVSAVKGTGTAKVEIHFSKSEDQHSKKTLPVEVMEYLTLKKNIPGLTRSKNILKGDTSAYEIEFSFQAVDDNFSRIAGR